MKAFVLKEPGVVGWHDAPEPRLKQPYGAILRERPISYCLPCIRDSALLPERRLL